MISIKDNLYTNDLATQIEALRTKLNAYKDSCDSNACEMIERIDKNLLKNYEVLLEVINNG